MLKSYTLPRPLDPDMAERLALRLDSSASLYIAAGDYESAGYMLEIAREIRQYADADDKPDTPPEFVIEMFRRVFKERLDEQMDDQPAPEPDKGSGIILP